METFRYRQDTDWNRPDAARLSRHITQLVVGIPAVRAAYTIAMQELSRIDADAVPFKELPFCIEAESPLRDEPHDMHPSRYDLMLFRHNTDGSKERMAGIPVASVEIHEGVTTVEALNNFPQEFADVCQRYAELYPVETHIQYGTQR